MLQIRKLSNKTWKHIDTNDGAFILTKFYAKEEFNEFLIVESYGAKRRKYLISEIEVYDIGGTSETFANFEDLFLRLDVLKYPAFYVDGEFTFNPSSYDLIEFQNADANPFVRRNSVLSSDIDNYDTATLPLSDTDKLLVNQGGTFKEVAKSEIGVGSNNFIQEPISTTGINALDFDINSFDKITQTGSLEFAGINISGIKKIEKTFLIQGSNNPAHTITFPTSWINLSGVNADSSKVNYIEISLINGTINYSIAKYNIPDVTAPALLKASFLLESMNTIELLYSEVIDASVVTNTSWYTVAGKTVTAVTILGNKVRVVVNTAFAETDNPLVTFTNQVVGNGIQDASGNKVPNFSQNIGLITYRFDSFDRVNSTTSINSPSDGGSNWVTPFGAVWGIDTNKAYCFGANTTTNQANAVYLESGESNVTVRMKLTYGVTGAASTSILLNYVDSNNYFLIQFGKLNTNLQYSVLKVSGGTLSTVISTTTFATWVSGTEYTFIVKNNNGVITLYNGTTSLVQLTDVTISGTKHGIRIFSGSGSTGNTDRFNDFGVYYG